MVIPNYHLLFHGILGKAWTVFLSSQEPQVLSRHSRQLMDARSTGLVRTNDFKNPYNNLLHKCGSWKWYDWAAWAEVWYHFVMQGIPIEGTLPTPD